MSLTNSGYLPRGDHKSMEKEKKNEVNSPYFSFILQFA